MKTSLGPIPLSLGRVRLIKFYKEAVKNRFDDFYIGEISCPQRGVKSKDLLLDIAHIIKDNGKNLFVSSYALVTKMSQIEDLRDLLQYADGLEVNNLAFLSLVNTRDPSRNPERSEGELDFDKTLVAGPFLNIYNWQSANYFARLGFKRVVLPQELTLESIIDFAKNSELEIEITFHGRKTLAISRRCYYLRALDLTYTPELYSPETDKSAVQGLADYGCKMNCLDKADGLSLNELFRINGKEILSEKIHLLDKELPLLENSGVDVLRYGYGSFN